jgi:hypothetical protein
MEGYLTTKQKLVAGAAAAAIVVVGIIVFKALSDDDEAPIIVRNGSMDFDIDDPSHGEWKDNNNAWSFETPSGKVHQNRFWVRADLKDGSHCSGTGQVVRIDYSDPSFHALFNPGNGIDGTTKRSQLTPKGNGQIEGVDAQHLRHGAHNDGGYITDVRVNGQPLKNGQADCTITQANLDQVNVCSNKNKCQ